jgi:GNAT superfamily N-acetyltransferase
VGAKRVLVGGLTLQAMAMSLYLVTREAWHFYVDPGHQGRGHGSALLQHALRRCDRGQAPASLESTDPANIPLYERHGFRVLVTIQVGSSPPIFPMLRAPRPAGSRSAAE